MRDDPSLNCKKDSQTDTSRMWREAISTQQKRISFSRVFRVVQMCHMLSEMANWIKDWMS